MFPFTIRKLISYISSFSPLAFHYQCTAMSVPEFDPHQCAEPNLLNMEVIRNQSELLRAECSRLISETDHQCKHMQNDHRKKLRMEKRELLDGASG